MTYVPGQGACLRCLLGNVPSRKSTLSCSQAGILGAVTGILGSLQALEAIKYLLEIGDLLVGKVLHFDGLTMGIRIVPIAKSDPDCTICGNHPTILTLADNREEYEESKCCFTSEQSKDIR